MYIKRYDQVSCHSILSLRFFDVSRSRCRYGPLSDSGGIPHRCSKLAFIPSQIRDATSHDPSPSLLMTRCTLPASI